MMATGTKESQRTPVQDGAIYYNVPVSAPGSHNRGKCLLTEGSVASLPSRTSLQLASSNSSTLEAANLESATVGQHQVDVKKSSPSKLPVLKSKSAPVPVKRTTLSRVLKKKANREKTGSEASSSADDTRIIHAYQNCPLASSETSSAHESDLTCREDATVSKIAKKKNSSSSGIFGSWLRKRGKDSRSSAKSVPPLPVITVENVDCSTSDGGKETPINLEIEVDLRESGKNKCSSLEFSPRAVSGVSWKFSESPENNVDKSLGPKTGLSDHCSRSSSASIEKDGTFQQTLDSSFESFVQSPVDIYSKQIDMDLTNESMKSTSDNLSGASVGTLEAVRVDASVAENIESSFSPSGADYCNLDWSEGNYQVLKCDSDSVDGKAQCVPVEVHDECATRDLTSAPDSKSTHFDFMSVHNVNYSLISSNIDQLGDSRDDAQCLNDAAEPRWQHLLNPPRSIVFPVVSTHITHSRLADIAEGESENQSSTISVASTVNSTSDSIDKNKSDTDNEKRLSKSLENTSKFPAVESKIASHYVSSSSDLILNSVITTDTVTSAIENLIKDESSPIQEYDLSTLDNETDDHLIKRKVSKDEPVGSNAVDSPELQNCSYENIGPSSKFESEATARCSDLSPHEDSVQSMDVASNRKSSTDLIEDNGSNRNLSDRIVPQSFECPARSRGNFEEHATNEIGIEKIQTVSGELEPEMAIDTKEHPVKSTSDGDTTDTDEEELEQATGNQKALGPAQGGSESAVSPAEIYNASYTAKATYVKPKVMSSTQSSAPAVQPATPKSDEPSGFSNDLYLVCGGKNKTPLFETCPDLASSPKIPGTSTYYDLSNKPRDLVVNECYPCMPGGYSKHAENIDLVTFEPGNFDFSLLPRLFALDLEDGTSEKDREVVRGIRENLVDWQKKNEWLTKKRRMKTFRNLGGSSSEVVILHASDGTAWARYLSEFLLSALAYRPCMLPAVPPAPDSAAAPTDGAAPSAVSNPIYASRGSVHSSGSGSSQLHNPASGSVNFHSYASAGVGIQATAVPNHPATVCCCSTKLHQKNPLQPSVECRNVEQVLGPSVPPILAQRLHTARVQIVVITPGFLSHVNDPQLDVGRVVVPRRVIGLMVGTSCADVNDRHLGALFSFKEWPLLRADRPSVWLCAAVLCRALAVLCSSRAYKGYGNEPPRGAFRICPSKVTEHQRHVYLMVEDHEDLHSGGGSDQEGVMVSLDGVARDDVCIELRYDGGVSRVLHWKYHNPYCVSFKMSDEVLRQSQLVEVRLAVEGAPLGSGKIKCENKMDTIAAFLSSISNAADVMCQSLGLSSVPGSLDQHLAACVRRGFPPFTSDSVFPDGASTTARRTTPRSSSATWSRDSTNSTFPTWLHFAAHYGLIELTAALLTVPGWREAVRMPDCDGNTPDRIAQAMGHDNLAERLEYLALMATDESLAAFEAPPNLSDLTINSRLVLPSPHLTPKTEGILRTSSTGSNRSADSFRSVSSPNRPNACSSSALRAISGPPHMPSSARHSTSDILSSTPASLPSVLPKASSRGKFAPQELDSRPVAGPWSRIKGVRSYQTVASCSKHELASDQRTACKVFETTVKCEGSAPSNCENDPKVSGAVADYGCINFDDASRNYVISSNGVLTQEVENALSNYDTVSIPRPVPLAHLTKASIQSVMMGSTYAKPVPFRRQRSDESSSSRKTMAKVFDDERSKSTECILEDRNVACEKTNFSTYNNLSADGRLLDARPLPMHDSGNSLSRTGQVVKPNDNVETLPAFRCPDDSLPALPPLELRGNLSKSTNGVSSDARASDQSIGAIESNRQNNNTLSSANGSALHDSQVLWLQRSQASESSDSSYLDMTRSDTSAFNSSLSMVQGTQSNNNSKSMLTLEQLIDRLNRTTFNSTRLHHQSESELHESYIESSSFVLPSEMLEYAALTRSVTLPTYTTSRIHDTDFSANSTDVTSSSSSSPMPNDAEARINPPFPTESPNVNTSVVDDGPSGGFSAPQSSFSSPTVPTLPFPHSSSAAVEGYGRTHERIRFPVNGVETRSQISGPNGSLTNLVRHGVSASRPTRLTSQHGSVGVPASRAAVLDDAAVLHSGSDPAAALDTRAVHTGLPQQGVAARLKGFFKVRSKQRFGGGRSSSPGHMASPHPGDPHNDYVDDPTAAVQRSGSTDALANGVSLEASAVSVSAADGAVGSGARLLQPPMSPSTSAQLAGVFNARPRSASPANSDSSFLDSGEHSSSTQVSSLPNGRGRVPFATPVSSSHNCPVPTTLPESTRSTASYASGGLGVNSSNSHFNHVHETTSRHKPPADARKSMPLDTPAEPCARIHSEQPPHPVQPSLRSGHALVSDEVLHDASISTYVNTSPQAIASLESAQLY